MTVYREYLNTQGESLLSPIGALDQLERVQAFGNDTWLPLERISAGLSSAPLVIPGVDHPGRRFADVNPVALWHPLFWLPDEVAFRQRWNHPSGTGILTEELSLWHTRVALQLTYAGLYAPDQGWLDILSVYGLDITDPDTVNRVAAWQSGGEDPVLDSIDLTAVILDALPMNEAISTAAGIASDLKAVQWAIQADSLVQLLDETRAEPTTTNSSLRAATVNVAYLGAACFSDLPWGGAPAAEHDTQWSHWADTSANGAFSSPAQFIEQSLTPIYQRLHEIRERFWPAVVSGVRDAQTEAGVKP